MEQATAPGSGALAKFGSSKIGLSGEKTLGPAFGPKRLKIAPWQGNRFIALIGPTRNGQRPRAVDIERGLLHLADRGVRQAVTPAMSAVEAEAFLRAGFKQFERLHLLSCPLSRPVETETTGDANRSKIAKARDNVELTNARPWHTDAVLDVDSKAFSGFWRFDQRSLNEAKHATSSRRYRVARLSKKIVGYAITGRSVQRGYLQRLAVDPSVQGQGIASLLIDDGFRWLRSHQATTCLVNTQESNERALSLYEHLGFRRQPQGLVVLRWNRDP